jgi:succinoglycan biosynthesis protein ExoV
MGYFNEAPNVCNPDWTVYFVRGPRTAKVLGISPELAVGDSAILLRGLFKDAPRTNELISFMPHYHSMDRGNWPEICSIADINLIDPRGPIEGIIQAILRSRLVIAESMHGAIVSDALRVPWLAVRPNKKIHRAKWYDWAEALNIDLHPEYMFASSLTNLLPKKVMRNLKPMENSKAALLVNEMIAHNAARRLNVLKEHEGNLSCDTSIDHAHEVMLGKIEQLRRENDR